MYGEIFNAFEFGSIHNLKLYSIIAILSLVTLHYLEIISVIEYLKKNLFQFWESLSNIYKFTFIRVPNFFIYYVLMFQVVSQSDHHSSGLLLTSVLRVHLHALGTNQSTLFLQHLFAVQRSFVFKFPGTTLFKTSRFIN